jgi:hypothetical protein
MTASNPYRNLNTQKLSVSGDLLGWSPPGNAHRLSKHELRIDLSECVEDGLGRLAVPRSSELKTGDATDVLHLI